MFFFRSSPAENNVPGVDKASGKPGPEALVQAPNVHFCTFRGTNAALRRHAARGWQQRGKSVVSRRYLRRQASALIKFAQSTKNPELAAVLVERAADLKAQVDQTNPSVDSSPQAPDVEPSPR
jgi:hypothetical protein